MGAISISISRLSLVFLFAWNALAFEPGKIVTDIVDSATNLLKDDPCAPGSQPNFVNKDEFIKLACGEGDIDKILNTIRAKNGADAINLYTYGQSNLDLFSRNLKFFRESQNVNLLKSQAPTEMPKAKKTGSPVRCWLTSKDTRESGQVLQFGNFHVVGNSKELLEETERYRKYQAQSIRDRFSSISPDCLLVDGVDMEQGLSCEKVLEIALTPETQLTNRNDLGVWWAFSLDRKMFGSTSKESGGKASIEPAYLASKACKNPLMVLEFDRIQELGPALIEAVGPLKNVNFKNTCPKGQKY